MKNTDLTKKIKELRTKMGLSQGELAELSQLNLRTVQRIESGDTEPRGDSLKRLANALNVMPNDLIEWTEKEDKGILIFLNLSALAFIAFPLMGGIVPLTIYMLKKDQVKNINETGKKLLNFQITWCLLIFLGYILLLCTMFLHFNFPFHFNFGGLATTDVLICVPLLYYGLNIVTILFNAYRSYAGKAVIYKPAIRFLR
ncbi:helix-turn-helix domain-containing protein [Mucilaginibacter sp. FT3.2]|uniref:helix-turn-helix domain-containing protein n=1 Tax=Mucilaginibacter sp. FT3.2 TaxID=2723090 RepID=UPI00160A6BB0|nr:helix-turn-helix domain-containing protein [Mucilaginibacter sp. FT3.2]MBB6234012.1 putative Tic20 family protein [Mucilaginibacter sp. FT3.2]